jgi:hypothetical protein
MPELEQSTRRREGPTEPTGTDGPGSPNGPAETTLAVGGADVTVSGDPTGAEAAALAAALAEHLRTAAESEADEEPRYAVDPWCLAGRLKLRSRSELPAACRSGREWKVAGRTGPR